MTRGIEATVQAVEVAKAFIELRNLNDSPAEVNKVDAAMLATICTMVADNEFEIALKTIHMIGTPTLDEEEVESAEEELAPEMILSVLAGMAH